MHSFLTSCEIPAPPIESVHLVCRVTRDDVDAMLDAYDSGMCDTITGNCLSRALARLLQRQHPVPLIRHRSEPARFSIDGHGILVPSEITEWLEIAEYGASLGPIEFTLEIPIALLPPVKLQRHHPVSKFPLVILAS